MLRLLFKCMVWSLGARWEAAETASGFGESQLIPQRERNAAERFISAASTLLTVITTLHIFMNYEALAFVYADDSIILTIPALLWAAQTLVRPSLPMDREAIAVGLWSFGPYLPLFLLGAVNLIPLVPLVWQLGGVPLLITLGIARDIRRESH